LATVTALEARVKAPPEAEPLLADWLDVRPCKLLLVDATKLAVTVLKAGLDCTSPFKDKILVVLAGIV
jgi:hypothetical protein